MRKFWEKFTTIIFWLFLSHKAQLSPNTFYKFLNYLTSKWPSPHLFFWIYFILFREHSFVVSQYKSSSISGLIFVVLLIIVIYLKKTKVVFSKNKCSASVLGSTRNSNHQTIYSIIYNHIHKHRDNTTILIFKLRLKLTLLNFFLYVVGKKPFSPTWTAKFMPVKCLPGILYLYF